MNSTSPQPKYRPDIDGLRALSVIAVILFHFSVPGFRGGFVGVDIFFVISGYLITQLLVLRRELPFRRWLAEFYVRRARRILPALLLMLVVSSVVAAWLFAPSQFRDFGKSLALSVEMLANYAAEQTADYFASSWSDAPLTHLWSIAVEEQFYLLYPLMLFLILRFAPLRTQWALLAVAVLASFTLCVWASSAHPRANYYLPMTRAWELGTGALLGLHTLSWTPRRSVRELLGVAGLAAIVASVLFYSEGTPFPGWYALLPCLGAAALIANGAAGGSSVNRLLAIRPLVFVGLISYALYLWHLPLKSFRDYYMVTPPGHLQLLVLLAALTAIAAMSWKWFEVPLRRRRLLASNSIFLAMTGVIAVILIAFGYGVWRSDGLPQRLSSEEQRILRTTMDVPYDLERECLLALVDRSNAGTLCRFGTANPPDNIVLLWGDSHALMLLPGVRAVAQRHGAQVQFSSRSSCAPLMQAESPGNSAVSAACEEFNIAMVRAIERIHPRMVILTAYWGYSSTSNVTGEMPADPTFNESFGPSLEATLRRIRSDSRRICLVRDVPKFRYSVPHALAMAHRRGMEPDFNTLTLADARRAQRPFDAEFDRLEALGLFVSVNPRELLCASGVCRMRDDHGALLYRDAHHLTPDGARFVEPAIEACFSAEDHVS